MTVENRKRKDENTGENRKQLDLFTRFCHNVPNISRRTDPILKAITLKINDGWAALLKM